jgi:hypothetical protein
VRLILILCLFPFQDTDHCCHFILRFTSLDAFDAKIGKAAKEVNLKQFQWLTEGKVGATWLAHRLLWYALQKEESNTSSQSNGSTGYTPSLQEKLASRLYLAFHHESQDLSSFQVLANLAVEVGVFSDEAEAMKWLKSDEGEEELNQAIVIGMVNGVQSVPFLILGVGMTVYHHKYHAD